MSNVISNRFNDKDDLIIEKALLEEAKKENVKLNNAKIIRVSNLGIEEASALDVQKELESILKIKEEIFGSIDLDIIDESDYNALLNKYYDSIKIKSYTNDDDITRHRYPNINFDNLSEESLKYLTNGDKLYDYISTVNIDDYSAVILQWCCAVELELRNKIYKCINSNDIKKDITSKSLSSNYFIINKSRKANFKPLMVNDMMGFYGAIKKFGLEKYIFDMYISKCYRNFSFELFEKIIEYVTVINKYRDESAHSIVNIKLDKRTANKCKEYIVASKKILEILSNL